MATETKIDYKDGKGFWIDESDMEVVLYFVREAFKKLKPSGTFASHIEWYLQTAVEGGFAGMLVLDWADYLKNSSQEQQMIQVLEKAVKILEAKGTTIPAKDLQATRAEMPESYRGEWKKPVKTSELTKVIDALIQMINGDWTSTNHAMEITY